MIDCCLNTLFISPEPWNAHTVSKHHYAMTLAKQGNPVYFLNPPNNQRKTISIHNIEGYKNLFVISAPQIAKGMRFYPSWLRRWLEKRWLRKLEKQIKKKIDTIWLFENSRFYDMRFAGNRLKIYQQVDLNQDFHPEIAARTADYVFCTSQPIFKQLNTVRKDVKIINHGVRIEQFDPMSEAALFSKESVNCLYIGNLSMKYLDRDLIVRCVKHLPEVCFNFVGGFDKNDPFQDVLAKHPNVRLHGKVDSSRILPILSNADVLMVVYQKEHFTDQSNPHKMMEYMMSGKVTVATYTSEYDAVSDLLAMARPDDDYVCMLEKVIGNLNHYNSNSLKAARRAFALNNTYEKQLNRIAQALGSHPHLLPLASSPAQSTRYIRAGQPAERYLSGQESARDEPRCGATLP